MSRRSILLATTFSVALVSLASVAPASAHGFGFGGFGGGGSFAFHSSAYSGFSRAPMAPMSTMGGRFNGPAAASVIGGHVDPPRNPGIAAPGNSRYPVGGDVGRVSNINSVETGARLPKSGGSEGVPNVTGAPRIIGQGQTPEHGPGISNVPSNGPTINLPGTQGLGQKGPREVPGYGHVGDGPQVNVPGSIDRHAPDEASKVLSKAEDNGKQLLDQVGKGGPNSLNVPTSPGAGVDVSDDTSGKKSGSGGSGKSGSSGSGGGTGKTGGSGSSIVVAPGVAGSNGSGPTKDGGTQTVSTMQVGNTTYQVVTVKDKDKNIVSVTYSEKGKDGKITTTTTGPEIPSKKNNETPNDDDTGTTTGSLNPSSSVGKTGHGGGTDNNGTETATQATQLNGSVVSRTGHGDGTGNHGDNNTVDKNGALSANTSLARKDYGDGGGSDNRDGGTSLAAPRTGGGDPHQRAAAAAALGD